MLQGWLELSTTENESGKIPITINRTNQDVLEIIFNVNCKWKAASIINKTIARG
jgi:hypothetical protein